MLSLCRRKPEEKYLFVRLCKSGKYKNKSIHRLVANAFIYNSENKLCVNHIDGNGGNNNVENLEWCTYSENELHSYGVLKKKNAARKLNELQAYSIKLWLENGCGLSELGRLFGVSKQAIMHIRNGINFKHIVNISDVDLKEIV